MNRNVRLLVMVLGCVFVCLERGEAQDLGGSADALFEEAQRYHLGLDRAVDYAKAMALYKKTVLANSKHKDAYYNMAHLCISQKRYDLAITYYKRVIGIDPQDSDAYNNLGTVYMRQGDMAKAKRAYAKAVQLNRDLAMAYYNLTFIFFKAGDQVKAEKAISEALRVEPENAEFLKLQSQIKGEVGKLSDWWAVAAFGGFGGVIVGYYWLFGRKGV